MTKKSRISLSLFSLTLLLLALCANSWGKVLSINERLLKDSLEKNSHRTGQAALNSLGASFAEKQILDHFAWNLVGQGHYFKSSERAFSNFAPVTSPVTSYKLGVSKAFSSGISTSLSGVSEQYSNSFVNKGTTSGFEFSLSMDLYKDLLGGLTQKKLDVAHLGYDIAEMQSHIHSKVIFEQLRMLYWQLIAKNESLTIAQKLFESAKVQALQAQRRFKNSIADSGEVARYESQVASREAHIISLNYQKETLVQQLKEALPELAEHEVILAPYDLEKTVAEVLACTVTIKSNASIPYEYTHYDEILKAIENQYAQQKLITKKYNEPDLKMNSTYKRIGKDFGTSRAIEELSNDPGNSIQLGLTLSIPLSSEKKTTQDIQKIIDEKKYLMNKREITSRLGAYHTQVVRSITLLQKVIAAQKINSMKLEESLRVTRKKYSQARIDFRDLINDQDAFLSSNLEEIDTKYVVIKTILEYFSVFTETPCALNI